MNKGWECPKCGRVYAPWVEKCKYCGNHNFQSIEEWDSWTGAAVFG